MPNKRMKYIVVCEVIGVSSACGTIKEARKARDRYDFKFPFVPGGIDRPAMILHIDEYLAYVMKEKNMPVPDGLKEYEDLDELEEIL